MQGSAAGGIWQAKHHMAGRLRRRMLCGMPVTQATTLHLKTLVRVNVCDGQHAQVLRGCKHFIGMLSVFSESRFDSSRNVTVLWPHQVITVFAV